MVARRVRGLGENSLSSSGETFLWGVGGDCPTDADRNPKRLDGGRSSSGWSKTDSGAFGCLIGGGDSAGLGSGGGPKWMTTAYG